MLSTINIIYIVGAGSKPALVAQHFVGDGLETPPTFHEHSVVTPYLVMDANLFQNIASIIVKK